MIPSDIAAALPPAAVSQIIAEDQARATRPLVRLWNAEWALKFTVEDEYQASFGWVSNDTGSGQLELPFKCDAAQWIHDHQGRIDRGEGRSVCITVDYCGARWSGVLDKYSIQRREDGEAVLVADFWHDYEHLKWMSVWSNPFLPAIFQFPRAFILAGPVTWILKLALLVNIWREHNPLITWPDDPLDLNEWFTSFDMSTWHMVVAPGSFLEAMESGVVWGVITSRWSTWHDMAHTMLEDSELSVVCDRYLAGDDPPWEGANLRHGTLVIDIVDKSGIMVGTAHGGTIFDGLVRTVVEWADDFIDSSLTLVADSETPVDYFLPGNRFTDKVKPYVVYRDGETSTIETSEWYNSPAKGVQVSVGGHSMPGVNETISATIQAGFDILGNLAQIGSIGGAVDSLLKPLYEDTILAWWAVKSPQRAQHTGWERLFEYFQSSGSAQAYTLASLMVLRAGFWATKTTISWKVAVSSGVPFLIGDRAINDAHTGLVARKPPKGAPIKGFGHYFLDDRVGLCLTGDTKINMDRCRKLDLTWSADDNNVEWKIGIGDDRILQDPAQRAWSKIETLIAGLREVGVWLGLVIAGASAATGLAFTLSSQPADTTMAGATGPDVGVLRGELMPPQTVGGGGVLPVSGGLRVSALNLTTIQSASAAHTLTVGSHVSVLGRELMAPNTVSLSGVPVGSMTNLVNRVFAVSSPGEILQPVVRRITV